MGDRAWVQIESKEFDTPVLFYGHWVGEDGLKAVQDVLNRTTRIGDPGYLTAQLFYKFAERYDGELGFGIYSGTISPNEESNPSVYVDVDDGSYKVGDGEWISNQELRENYEYGTSTRA